MQSEMTLDMFGLWPIAVARFVDETGKVFRFVHCMTVASSAAEARKQANDYTPEYGLDWLDPQMVMCRPVLHVGTLPPKGFIAFDDVEGY